MTEVQISPSQEGSGALAATSVLGAGLVLSWFTGSSISSRFGNIEDASAPGSIQTNPATEVKPFRLSPALNNVLRRLLKTSRNFPGSSLFQCPFSNRNKHWNTKRRLLRRSLMFLVFMTCVQVAECAAAPARPSSRISPCSRPPTAAVAEKPAASPGCRKNRKAPLRTQGSCTGKGFSAGLTPSVSVRRGAGGGDPAGEG